MTGSASLQESSHLGLGVVRVDRNLDGTALGAGRGAANDGGRLVHLEDDTVTDADPRRDQLAGKMSARVLELAVVRRPAMGSPECRGAVPTIVQHHSTVAAGRARLSSADFITGVRLPIRRATILGPFRRPREQRYDFAD